MFPNLVLTQNFRKVTTKSLHILSLPNISGNETKLRSTINHILVVHWFAKITHWIIRQGENAGGRVRFKHEEEGGRKNNINSKFRKYHEHFNKC